MRPFRSLVEGALLFVGAVMRLLPEKDIARYAPRYRGVRVASIAGAMVVGVVLSFTAAIPASATAPGLYEPGGGVASSRQFGIPDQTDVFTVDHTGALTVSWVDGGGSWAGPLKITGPEFAPPGSHVAVSRQFGIPDQTDVFVVANTGALTVSWVDGGGSWAGPLQITDTGFAPAGSGVAVSRQFGISDQTDVFVVANTGALTVSWVDGGGVWGGPLHISDAGFAPAGSGVAASQQFGISDQTDVFAVDHAGALNVSFVDGGGDWGGPLHISDAGFAPAGSGVAASQQFGIPNQTDVFAVNSNRAGGLDVFFVDGGGSWHGQNINGDCCPS
jgi:head-tail adaptor